MQLSVMLKTCLARDHLMYVFQALVLLSDRCDNQSTNFPLKKEFRIIFGDYLGAVMHMLHLLGGHTK